MTSRATSTFTVDDWRETASRDRDGVRTSAARVTKTFTGDLQAVGVADVLMLNGVPEGSGSYVALERIEGALHGAEGGFALVHCAHRSPDGHEGTWRIAPGSGTGDLAGIRGTATLDVHTDGTHVLTLEYALPGA